MFIVHEGDIPVKKHLFVLIFKSPPFSKFHPNSKKKKQNEKKISKMWAKHEWKWCVVLIKAKKFVSSWNGLANVRPVDRTVADSFVLIYMHTFDATPLIKAHHAAPQPVFFLLSTFFFP